MISYEIKKALFEGKSVTMVPIPIRHRYRALRYRYMARICKATSYKQLAEHLKISRQNMEITARRYNLKDILKKVFSRNEPFLEKPALFSGVDPKGNIILLPTNTARAFSSSAKKQYTDLKLLRYCSSPKLEALYERFKNEQYKLKNETDTNFPYIYYHGPSRSYRLNPKFIVKILGLNETWGHYVSQDEAIEALKRYILTGEIRTVCRGQLLRATDKRKKPL